ncbi:MAG: hypothetical protein P8P46_02635 [Alphaproteobacteria bacterium]|nr:hypothetical protein [Alphaproteobacteria bacterium]
MSRDIQKLASRQLYDYRTNNPGSCFKDPEFILDISDAYELQAKVTKLRVAEGENIIGYKVGCTGPGTIKQFGMDGPIRGTLFSSELEQTGIQIKTSAFTNLAVEGEMAVTIGEDGEIESAFPVIELHNYIFRAPIKNLPELIANNGLNAGVVLPKLHWQQSTQYITQFAQLTVKINDKLRGSGNLWPHHEGPSGSVNWLKNNLEEFDLSLSSKQIVLAGTTLGLYPVKPGDTIDVYIDEELAVKCNIET